MEDRFEIVEELPQEESLPQQLGRGIARGASRAFETVGGLPGDILSTVSGAANYLTGGATPTYEEFTKDKPFAPRTSAQLRQATEGLSEGYLAPQSTGEKFVDDIISDVTSLAIPIGGKVPLKSAFIRSLGGNIAGHLAKEAGYGETGQAIAKFTGMTLAGGLGTRKALATQAQQGYQKADALKNSIPEAQRFVEAPQLRTEGLRLLTNASKDIQTPKNKAINEALSPILNAFTGNKISVDEAVNLKQSVNELIGASKDKNARGILIKISGMLGEPLKEFGKQHPEWYQNWSEAQDITAGLKASDNILSYLKEKIPSDFLKSKALDEWLGRGTIGAGLLGSFLKYGATGTAKNLAGIAGPLIGARTAARPLIFALKSKTGRQAYFDIIKDAFQQNPKALIKNVGKLDRIVQKYEQEGPRFEIIEE